MKQEEGRFESEERAFDKMFEVGRNQELCHHTGFYIVDERGDEWNEYEDREGGLHYGR